MPRIGLWATVACILAVTIHAQAFATPCDLTQVPYCTFTKSPFGFFVPGDTWAEIDFETLPNGAPSQGGVPITPAFNYVLQGALFTSAFPGLRITGNSTTGYDLTAYTSNLGAHNSISAQLSHPERGIGLYALGHATLRAFDENGALITSVTHTYYPQVYFLGIRSSIPIASIEFDNYSNSASFDNFTMIHIPVPEPASAALLLLAAPFLFRRSRPE